jgi:5-deoxy-glucuronate isomerase
LRYTSKNMTVRPTVDSADPNQILTVTPEQAGWDYITFQARRLNAGETWSSTTAENEFVFVNLNGKYSVDSNRGEWTDIGGRKTVFESAGHALYLPRHTEFTVKAEQSGEFAVAWVPTDEDHEPWLIKPEDVSVSVRGGDHATRQINDLLPPGSPVHRIVLVEVYTPGGNWSSYPGHKHDTHIENSDGSLLEADLEEVYFYKFDRPNGWAFQRVYTDDRSPLQKAGNPIDAACTPTENCAVIIPEGHHPVSSPPGYTTYYLNVLAGSAQALTNQEDEPQIWVKETYTTVDDRVPLY